MRRYIAVALLLVLVVGVRGLWAQTTPAGVGGGSFSGGTITQPLVLPDGSCTNPSLRFAGDADTGLALVGSVVVMCVNGSSRVAFNQGNLTLGGANFLGLGTTTFAALALVADGQAVYCSDCTQANPTAGSGSGAYVVRVASVNVGLPTGSGGSPGGSSTELQYRGGASTFNAATGTTVNADGTVNFGATFATSTGVNEQNAGNSGSSITPTWRTGARQAITLTATSVTINAPLNPVANTDYTLRLIQDGTGNRKVDSWFTITWLGCDLPPCGAPALSTTAGASDFITCRYLGTTYYCTGRSTQNVPTTSISIDEEFIGNAFTTSSAIGKYGWNRIDTSGTGALMATASEANAYGIARVCSGSTDNNVSSLALLNASSGLSQLTAPGSTTGWILSSRFRPSRAEDVTGVGLLVGLTNTSGTPEGMYAGFDTDIGDGSINFVANDASPTQGSRWPTSVAISTAWRRVIIAHSTSGQIDYILLSEVGAFLAATSISANVPTSNLAPDFRVYTRVTGAKCIDAEKFTLSWPQTR